MKKNSILILLFLIAICGCSTQGKEHDSNPSNSSDITMPQSQASSSHHSSAPQKSVERILENAIHLDPPSTVDYPPVLEFEAGALSQGLITAIQATDILPDAINYRGENNFFNYNGYVLCYIPEYFLGPTNIYMISPDGSEEVIFRCNQTIDYIERVDNHILRLAIISDVLYQEIALHDYYLYDILAQQLTPQDELTYEKISYYDKIFTIAKEHMYDETYDIYLNQQSNDKILAKDAIGFHFAGNMLYYALEDRKLYSTPLNEASPIYVCDIENTNFFIHNNYVVFEERSNITIYDMVLREKTIIPIGFAEIRVYNNDGLYVLSDNNLFCVTYEGNKETLFERFRASQIWVAGDWIYYVRFSHDPTSGSKYPDYWRIKMNEVN